MALHSQKIFEAWLPALFDGLFHWDFLLPAFKGTKIRPMDIDCCIERKGHFLMFETKKPGMEIQTGQKITLTNLWRNGKTTIIHLEGKSAENVSGYAIYSEWDDNKKDSVGDRELKTQDAFDLIFAVRRWFCRVSNMKAPDRNSWNNELWLWDYDGGIKAQLDAMQDRSSKPEMV